MEEVGDRAKIIAGTGTYNTAETIELTKEAAALGRRRLPHRDSLLLEAPAERAAGSLHGGGRRVQRAADDLRHPRPHRPRVERPTMVELAAHEHIVAVKDAVGDAVETAALRRDLDAAGRPTSRSTRETTCCCCRISRPGRSGSFRCCSHLIGPQIKQIFTAWNDGKIEEAQRIYLECLPLMKTIMGLTRVPSRSRPRPP